MNKLVDQIKKLAQLEPYGTKPTYPSSKGTGIIAPSATKLIAVMQDLILKISTDSQTIKDNPILTPFNITNQTNGIWTQDTQTAIKSCADFAANLLRIAHSFGYSPTKYNTESLKMLEEFASHPKTDIPKKQEAELAKVATEHLKDIDALFQEVNDNVLKNPRYQAMSANLPSYERKEALLPQDRNTINAWLTNQQSPSIQFTVEGPENAVISLNITGKDLVSSTAFDQWYKQQQLAESNVSPNAVYEAIEQTLKGKIESR